MIIIQTKIKLKVGMNYFTYSSPLMATIAIIAIKSVDETIIRFQTKSTDCFCVHLKKKVENFL